MLEFMALGDAFGAGLEFADPKTVAQLNDPSRGYVQHPKHPGIKPGMYTDDTQMALALALLMVQNPSEDWSPGILTNAFLTHFQKDPRQGYARGFQAFLEETPDWETFLWEVRFGSRKNGGAMRAAPVGLYPDLEEVLDRAAQQACVTHCSRQGLMSAMAAASLTHFLYYRCGEKEDLLNWMDSRFPGEDFSTPYRKKVGLEGLVAVRAAATALIEGETLTDVLKASVACTGDVDTVAAIAMFAAGASGLYPNDLPSKLYEDFEGGPFGMSFLQGVDSQLLEAFPR